MKDSKFWRTVAVAIVFGLFYIGWGLSRNKPAPAFDLFSSTAFGDAPLVEEFEEQSSTFLKVWNTDAQGNLHYRIVKLPGYLKGSRDLRSTIVPDLVSHVEFTTTGKRLVLLVPK